MFLVLILISFWCVLPRRRGRLMHSYQEELQAGSCTLSATLSCGLLSRAGCCQRWRATVKFYIDDSAWFFMFPCYNLWTQDVSKSTNSLRASNICQNASVESYQIMKMKDQYFAIFRSQLHYTKCVLQWLLKLCNEAIEANLTRAKF